MPLLMLNELVDFAYKGWCSPSGNETLRTIDANGTMFAGMINLDRDFADATGSSQLSFIHRYETYPASLLAQRLGTARIAAL